MKKLILVFSFLLLLAVVFVLSSRRSPPPPESTTTPDVFDNSPSTPSDRYLSYTPESFQAAAGKRRLLFFYANWCPTCRPVDAELSSRQAEFPEDLVVFRVNYNDPETDQDEKALAQKYAVTYQHTFVQVDQSGNPLTSYNGGDFDTILQNLE